MKTFTEWAQSKSQTITITCRDVEGNLAKLLDEIKTRGNIGHSFSIVVDPEGDDTQKFYWDGDGSDHIFEIKTS